MLIKNIFGFLLILLLLTAPTASLFAQDGEVIDIDDLLDDIEEPLNEPATETQPQAPRSPVSEPAIAEEPIVIESPEQQIVIEEAPVITDESRGVEPAPSRTYVEPEPPTTNLVAPKPQLVQTPLTEEQVDTLEGPSAIEPVPYSGLYYDADQLGTPQRAPPRQVDPKYEPGQSFVVVKKTALSNSLQAQLVSAKRALDLERYSSALQLYERLYNKHPKNKEVLLGLAVAQQKNGFFESAMQSYEELLERDPRNQEAQINMLGLLKQRSPSVAYRRLKNLWDDGAQSPGLAAQLGLASANVGSYEEAIGYLGAAASMEPSNPSHLYNMAVVADRAGAFKDAIDFYEKALELDAVYKAGRGVPRDQIYDRLSYLRRL